MNEVTRVEAGSNTSTVNLRVVRGDEMALKKAAPQLKRLVAGFPPLRSGVRDRVCHVGFCGGQSGAGVGFLRVLRFPLPNFIPPIAPKIILICHRGLYNRPKWPQYKGLIDRDLSRYLGTQSHPTNNNNNNNK
jgi:hypothetical protein